VELVRLAARDRTDAAIAKPETPFVRVDELEVCRDDRICRQSKCQKVAESGFP
jgi:hypothetical protein